MLHSASSWQGCCSCTFMGHLRTAMGMSALPGNCHSCYLSLLQSLWLWWLDLSSPTLRHHQTSGIQCSISCMYGIKIARSLVPTKVIKPHSQVLLTCKQTAWNDKARWDFGMRLLIQHYLPASSSPLHTHTEMSSLPFGSYPRPWVPYSMLAWHKSLCLSLTNFSSSWSWCS